MAIVSLLWRVFERFFINIGVIQGRIDLSKVLTDPLEGHLNLQITLISRDNSISCFCSVIDHCVHTQCDKGHDKNRNHNLD